MRMITEYAANFVQFFIWTWFVSEYCGYKFKGAKKLLGFLGVFILGFLEISFINTVVVYDGFLTLIMAVTYIVYSAIFLKGKIYKHIFVVMSSIAIIFTIASGCIFAFSYFTKLSTYELMAECTVYRILILIICRIAEYAIFKFILHLKDDYVLTKTEWSLLIAMSILNWINITLITNSALVYPNVIDNLFYCVLLVVGINVIIFYFLLKINKQSIQNMDYALLQMQYQNAKNSETKMKSIYDNNLRLKHDLEKHFQALGALAKAENTAEIREYLDSVYQNTLGSVQKLVFTSSDVFNAVVNIRLDLCKQKGIYPIINVSDEAVMQIKNQDMAVLFGNILDNAIEAAQYAENKVIEFKVNIKNEFVSIYVANTFNEKYSDITFFKTTKPDSKKHGYGMKNINRIIEESNGHIKIGITNENMVTVHILLKKNT